MTERIDHASAAQALIDQYTKAGPSAQVVAGAIVGHALLAIAEQMQIANRVELWRGWTDGDATERFSGVLGDGRLPADISAALGVPYPNLSPDCVAGKHRACSGDAWDDDTDSPTLCTCTCHELGGPS